MAFKDPETARAYQRRWLADNPERSAEYSRAYRARNLKENRARVHAWERANPEKKRAHYKVRYALRIGKLKRPAHCSRCRKAVKVQAHHEDYNQPLQVKWLCASCHRLNHQEKP